ncbi:MAG: 1-acyl-sn-glycerol-3-phosphate acyltransferase [Odoribacteraceae bacterium]|jgi:1-acyl-sn-glycerol-3-phosphate acyltransferase|nr:1-acyl-sn-glycerol-3-phosphate acyltransferase [Odoribacteraceae bacterium]
MKYLARLILKLCGWKLKGDLPADKKAVIISVPHTSIYDFIFGKLSFMSAGVPSYILVKKEFFFFPLGLLLRAMRVIPVDRGNRENRMVGKLVEEFNKRDTMYLTITPEGSRKRRKRWKKGFLLVARGAGVPVYLGRIDYKEKFCTFGPRFDPSDDPDEDLRYIMSTYRDANPRYPEHFSYGE